MHRSIGRVAALLGAGALALAVVTPAFAAQPLTYVATTNDMAPVTAGQAKFRVLHGSPDAPAVDVYANGGTPVVAGAKFGDITDYIEVPAASYMVKVCVAGSDPDVAANCVFNDSIVLAADTKSTITASGPLADITFRVWADDPNLAETAQTQVRVIHLSADTPAVDVLTQDGTAIGINGLAYLNRAPATGYAPFPPNTYDLKVCAAGSTTVCPLDLPALPLAAAQAYTVFAIGSFAAIPTTPTDPGVTPPASSTIGATTDGSAGTGNLLAVLAILGIAGLATAGMTRRFATRRVEK